MAARSRATSDGMCRAIRPWSCRTCRAPAGSPRSNYLYARASKDGLTIGVPQGPLVYAQIGKSPNVQFDARSYSWLGSANVTSNTCVFTKRAGIATANDLITKTVVIGGSGGSTEFVPNLLNALIGTKFNIVKGYKSTNEVIPAMERGEVDGHVRLGLGQRAGERP